LHDVVLLMYYHYSAEAVDECMLKFKLLIFSHISVTNGRNLNDI